MGGEKHGPNRLRSYLATHDTIMRQFLGKGVASSEDLSFSDLGNGVFLMEGTIRCLDDLRTAQFLGIVVRFSATTHRTPITTTSTTSTSTRCWMGTFAAP